MKKIIILLLPIYCFGQPKALDSVLKYDVNYNVIVSRVPDEIKGLSTGANNSVFAHRSLKMWRSNNNLLIGENDSVSNSNSNTIFATDALIVNTSYSTINGDGSWANCESCDEDGNFNKILGYNLFARGSNNKIGVWGQGKRYSNSSAIGNSLDVQNSNIQAFGFNTSFTQAGWGYGNNGIKFFVFADGRVNINGVIYRFPTLQGEAGSVLTNDGSGNLSWGLPVPTVFTATDQNGKSFIIKGHYTNK